MAQLDDPKDEAGAGLVETLRTRAEARFRQGDLHGAQQEYRALLLQRLDANGPITKAEVFMHLGEVHLRMGEPDEAEQMLRRAVADDPTLARASELLAEVEPVASADLSRTPGERFARASVKRDVEFVGVAGAPEMPESVDHEVPCTACGKRVPLATLSMTMQGEWACRSCVSAKSIDDADRKARATAVYRRCRCGTSLMPEQDPSVLVKDDEDGIDVEAVFQPSAYNCGVCGNSFKVRSVVTNALLLVVCGAFAATALGGDGGVVGRCLALTVALVGIVSVVDDHRLRVRHPRVR